MINPRIGYSRWDMKQLHQRNCWGTLAFIFLGLLMGAVQMAQGQTLAAKLMFDPAAAGAAGQITPNGGSEAEVAWTINKGGIDITVQANGKSSYPGIIINPKSAWDAAGYGHIEARVTNNGPKPIRVNLRLDNAGPWQENRYSANILTVKPGQTATLSTIFGYQYGKAAYQLDPKAITQAIIFCGKSDVVQNFHVEVIQAAGAPGEKPYVDPNSIATKPPQGVVLGKNIAVDATKQLQAKGGAKAALAADGKSLRLDFATGKDPAVTYKPAVGMWNFNEYLQLRIRVKNVGTAPMTPAVQLVSRGGVSPIVSGKEIAPGAEEDVVVPFAAAVPWKGLNEPEMSVLELKKDWQEGQAGTGTKYTSNSTTGIVFMPDKGQSPRSIQVLSIAGEMPATAALPAWLGQKPPVPGEWVKTFDDNFDGDKIDLKRWNIYTESEWHLGAQTHYSKDNVIVKDGKLILRVEKKRGHHNDNPAMVENDYATGYADTYGKWTQRYGYFEARMKLPTAPNMFLAFWMMPDRGLTAGKQYVRANTKEMGMEFDIMETLSIWGPNRHDFGMHWDG